MTHQLYLNQRAFVEGVLSPLLWGHGVSWSNISHAFCYRQYGSYRDEVDSSPGLYHTCLHLHDRHCMVESDTIAPLIRGISIHSNPIQFNRQKWAKCTKFVGRCKSLYPVSLSIASCYLVSTQCDDAGLDGKHGRDLAKPWPCACFATETCRNCQRSVA